MRVRRLGNRQTHEVTERLPPHARLVNQKPLTPSRRKLLDPSRMSVVEVFRRRPRRRIGRWGSAGEHPSRAIQERHVRRREVAVEEGEERKRDAPGEDLKDESLHRSIPRFARGAPGQDYFGVWVRGYQLFCEETARVVGDCLVDKSGSVTVLCDGWTGTGNLLTS